MKLLEVNLAKIMVFFVRLYQVFLSPFLGRSCRFEPTCSRYSIEAFKKFGFTKGTKLTFLRICRCHPFGGHGFDPVERGK